MDVGGEDLLKFKVRIRMTKRGNLSDMVVGARGAGLIISQAVKLGFSPGKVVGEHMKTTTFHVLDFVRNVVFFT